MDAFIGLICGWAPNFAPRGWAFCQGQLLSITQQTAMFSLLGTTYGGNGQTTFGLPNLAGRVAVTAGNLPGGGSYVQGQAGGSEAVTMTSAQMPMHTHGATLQPTGGGTLATTSAGTASSAANGYIPAALSGETSQTSESVTVNGYAPASTADTKLPGDPIAATVKIDIAGGSLPLPIVQPYQVIQSIICIQGLFPSRN